MPYFQPNQNVTNQWWWMDYTSKRPQIGVTLRPKPVGLPTLPKAPGTFFAPPPGTNLMTNATGPAPRPKPDNRNPYQAQPPKPQPDPVAGPKPPVKQGKPATGQGTGTSVPATTVPQPYGKLYKPNATGQTGSAAHQPIVLPGIEASGGSWAKYQDGSYVNYNSSAWRRVAGVNPTVNPELWTALPDSWKADMAGWDSSVRDAYLKAMLTPHTAGWFQGQWMTGQEAAQQIAKMAHDAAAQQAQAKQQQEQYKQQNQAGIDFRPTTYFSPTPYL